MAARGLSFSRSSFVHTTVVFSVFPARGLFAARRGMARVLRVIEIASEKGRWRFISLPLSSLRRREENAATFCSRLCRGFWCSCLLCRRACRSMSFARSISASLGRRDRRLRFRLCRIQLLWLRRQNHRICPSGGRLQTRCRRCPEFVYFEWSQWQRLRRHRSKELLSSPLPPERHSPRS